MTAISNDDERSLEWLGAADLPARVAARYARSGTDVERTALAANPALPIDVALLLSRDPSLGVRQTLAGNDGTDTEVLWALAGDSDLDPDVVADNWNAPVALKLSRPLWNMTRRSLEKFFLAVQATVEEREQVLELQGTLGPRSKRLLGEVWGKIR